MSIVFCLDRSFSYFAFYWPLLLLSYAAQFCTPNIYTPSLYLYAFVILSPYFFEPSLFSPFRRSIGHYQLYSWHLAKKEEINIPLEHMLTAWSHQELSCEKAVFGGGAVMGGGSVGWGSGAAAWMRKQCGR